METMETVNSLLFVLLIGMFILSICWVVLLWDKEAHQAEKEWRRKIRNK